MEQSLKQVMQERDKWKSLYNGLGDTVQRLEKEICQLTIKVSQAQSNQNNASSASEINKNILRQATEEHNRKEQEMVGLITKLKAKLREMGYDGDFDRLGQ